MFWSHKFNIKFILLGVFFNDVTRYTSSGHLVCFLLKLPVLLCLKSAVSIFSWLYPWAVSCFVIIDISCFYTFPTISVSDQLFCFYRNQLFLYFPDYFCQCSAVLLLYKSAFLIFSRLSLWVLIFFCYYYIIQTGNTHL